MPHEKITPQHWMLLDKETRIHLAKHFNIPVSGVTEIRDQELITDGRTMADLEALSLQAMCEYVGSQETFGRAFELTIAKAHSELHPPVGEIRAQSNSAVVSVEPIKIEASVDLSDKPVGIVGDAVLTKKRGRPSKSK